MLLLVGYSFSIVRATDIFSLFLQSVDKQQSWDWVTQHRLPLFLRSDLFSEYKLCKLLTTPAQDQSDGTSRVDGDDIDTLMMKPRKSRSTTKLPTNKKPHPLSKSSSSSSAVCLPSLNSLNDRDSPSASGDSSPSTVVRRHIAMSKSDIELGSKGLTFSVTTPSQLQQQANLQKPQKQVTLSADVPCIVLEEDSMDQAKRKCVRSIAKGSAKVTAEDLAFLGTKSGMNALWKFLKGTMGERNWLFWLDAEHVKYYTRHIDQQRYTVMTHYVVELVS